jgi:hypothetical protein
MSLKNMDDIEYLNMDKKCTRPHCAIRSHNHEIRGQTFAEFLNYLPHFWTISRRYNLDDKKLIKTYKYFEHSDNIKMEEFLEVIKVMADAINNENKDIELKKLQILYLYSILSTKNINEIVKEYPKLIYAVKDAFNRILIESKDELFIEQMVKLQDL